MKSQSKIWNIKQKPDMGTRKGYYVIIITITSFNYFGSYVGVLSSNLILRYISFNSFPNCFIYILCNIGGENKNKVELVTSVDPLYHTLITILCLLANAINQINNE